MEQNNKYKINLLKTIIKMLLLSFLLVLGSCKVQGDSYTLRDEEGKILCKFERVTFEKIEGGFGDGGIVVRGIYTNAQNEQLDAVDIAAEFYDKRGEYIGDSNTETYRNVKPNEIFEFKVTVPYFIKFDDIDKSKTLMSVINHEKVQ